MAQDGVGLVVVPQGTAATSTTPPAARDGWAEIARRLAEERHDFYVLDEFTYPLK